MHDMFDEYLAEEYKDVHVLWLHVHAGQAIQMVDKLVRKPEDFKGLKIRVPGPTGTDVIKTLGATPVDMPVPDLPQALTTHVVDGALIPWEIAPALKLQDVTKYDIEGKNKWRLGTTTFQVSMNQGTWNKLPDDLKDVFNKATDADVVEAGRRHLARGRRQRAESARRCGQRATSSLRRKRPTPSRRRLRRWSITGSHSAPARSTPRDWLTLPRLPSQNIAHELRLSGRRGRGLRAPPFVRTATEMASACCAPSSAPGP